MIKTTGEVRVLSDGEIEIRDFTFDGTGMEGGMDRCIRDAVNYAINVLKKHLEGAVDYEWEPEREA